MKYAIIQIQGKQYQVSEGQELTLDRLPHQQDESFEVTDVLLRRDDERIDVGQPLVKGAKVTLQVVEHGKDQKIKVFKYKSKSKYRKTIGHRQRVTNVRVMKIV